MIATPLAGIKVAVSTCGSRIRRLLTEAQAALLATIEDSTDALSELVDNLCRVGRLQAGVLSVHLTRSSTPLSVPH